MHDSFRGLRLCQTVVHRAIEVVRNLRDLAVSNKGADPDETSIAVQGLDAAAGHEKSAIPSAELPEDLIGIVRAYLK